MKIKIKALYLEESWGQSELSQKGDSSMGVAGIGCFVETEQEREATLCGVGEDCAAEAGCVGSTGTDPAQA